MAPVPFLRNHMFMHPKLNTFSSFKLIISTVFFQICSFSTLYINFIKLGQLLHYGFSNFP
ncbi:hypothetical protein SLEP1_g42514 [Rubroshorea leprosula]|uniref:Uncharacterized protein n=1 Tax=Rubroshorea leprosula TaxID=152421 RepID=A0AAV5LA25_9ROSI|nr:hypothetical protein SLEP1_g42514 [Rubroshorea leprosula]